MTGRVRERAGRGTAAQTAAATASAPVPTPPPLHPAQGVITRFVEPKIF